MTQLRGESASLWNEVLEKQAIVEATFKMEVHQLTVRRAERNCEAVNLTLVISKRDCHMDLLAEQQRNEEESTKQDVEDFQRVAKLYEKGNTSVTRFSGSRRFMLLSATCILPTSAAIAQVEREREELKKQLASVDD